MAKEKGAAYYELELRGACRGRMPPPSTAFEIEERMLLSLLPVELQLCSWLMLSPP